MIVGYKMKKLIILLISLMIFLTGCDTLGSIEFGDILDKVGITDNVVDNDELPDINGSEDNLTEEENEPDKPNDTDTDVKHNYKAIVTSPTCDKSGYTTYVCSDCGDSYVANETSALGHDYSTYVIAPTCTVEGYTTYKCNVCDDSYTDNIVEALSHKYTTTVIAPGCTDKGYTIYTCTVCSYNYRANETSALGHNWQDATTEAPKTCINCGTTEGDKLPSTSDDGAYSEILYVSYIDVGQGDSILIKVGDCDILIDAGVVNMGTTVSRYLKDHGVDDIELMINTHPDADHCGGLTQVLRDFAVEEVWASPLTKTTNAYKYFASAVKSEGLTIKNPAVGTVFTYEYLTLTVLYDGSGTSNANDSSIIVMLEYGSHKFLFTGDASSKIEEKLVNNPNIDLSCDVLKVGHHGSRYSSSSSFLSATGAKYGIICVGEDNSYGHPTSDALTRLSKAGISVYRTDLIGSIVFCSNGESLTLPGESVIDNTNVKATNSRSAKIITADYTANKIIDGYCLLPKNSYRIKVSEAA